MNQAVHHTVGVSIDSASTVYTARAKHFDELAVFRRMRELEEENPAWFARLDDADVMVGDLNELLNVAQQAPGLFLSGHLYGIFNVRADAHALLNDFAPMGEPFTIEASRVIKDLHELFASSEPDYPQWFDQLDQCDDVYASVSDLQHLLATAPSSFLRGYVSGVLFARRFVDAKVALRSMMNNR